MTETSIMLLTLGGLLLSALAVEAIGRKTSLPRVSLLLLLGFVVGPYGFDFLHGIQETWFDSVANIALLMVGFLIGGKINRSFLKKYGKAVFILSLAVVLSTFALMSLGFYLFGLSMSFSLLMASIAVATDPAATLDVIHESKSESPFVKTLMGIVALDDVWGIFLFGFVLAISDVSRGHSQIIDSLFFILKDIGGAALLGFLLGIPFSYLSGRIQSGRPALLEALGMVLLCGGLAKYFAVSYLLASITMGITVANFSKHHTKPFHTVMNIEWPFLVLFFILAGANIQIQNLEKILWILVLYIVLRILSRFIGSYLSTTLFKLDPIYKWRMGATLMPQAGVALGLTLLIGEHFPEMKQDVLGVAISATVIFEFLGPILTRFAIKQKTISTKE
ncbi:MAG: cation:proton antiporter [Deltaproteobacteria bacterium]|nr:cation:proton antiporter [Deltaproteobacteria bacterium]